MTVKASTTPRLWRDRRFATYWFGQTVSQMGDRVSELALPLIAVTTLHASPAEVGIVTAAIWAPHLLSLVAGAWVDQQQHKKRLLIVANVAQALTVATLPIAYLFGWVSIWLLYAVAFVLGSGEALYHTSYPSFFVRLVRRDQYLTANSLLSATRSGSFIVGPAAGGALISAVTAPMAMVVDAVSFLVSAIAIGAVRVDEPPPPTTEDSRGLWRRAGQGIGFLARHAYLRSTWGCSTVVNLFWFIGYAVLILFASRTLGLNAAQIGLAFGIGASGGLVGAAIATPLARWLRPGWAAIAGSVTYCLPLAFIPLAGGSDVTKIAVLAAAEFVGSVGVMVYDITINSVQTALTPDRMRSRSAGAYSTVNYGVRPLGAIVGGFLGEWVGLPLTLVIAGVGGSLGVLWFWRSPVLAIRSVDDLEPVDVT